MTMPWNEDRGGGVGEGQKGERQKRNYRRELSVLLDVKDNGRIKAKSVIASAIKLIEHTDILACVPRAGNLYEITFKDKYSAEIIEDGLEIEGNMYEATKAVRDTFTVSFMNVPVYIEDEIIQGKLTSLGVEILSPMKRKMYEGTEIEDGTRFCRVRLPPNIKSLPFTMKLYDGDIYNYYRVIHNGQKKTCTVCGSDEHLKKQCPDFICYKCGYQGHTRRFCDVEPCEFCYEYRCQCGTDISDQTEEENGGINKDESECDVLCEKCGSKSKSCDCDVVSPDLENIEKAGENVISINEVDKKKEDHKGSSKQENNTNDDSGEIDNEIIDENKETNELLPVGSNIDTLTETVFGDVFVLSQGSADEQNTVETPADRDYACSANEDTTSVTEEFSEAREMDIDPEKRKRTYSTIVNTSRDGKKRKNTKGKKNKK